MNISEEIALLKDELSDISPFMKTHMKHVARKQKNTSSVYKGVYFNYNKWSASIMKEGKRYCLGVYKEEKKAAIAYNKAARLLYGESAFQNSIDD